MSHIAACILALSTLGTAADGSLRYSRQLRTEGPVTRSAWLSDAVRDVASAFLLDPHLLVALAWHESAFDRDRVSSTGARSIMQLTGKLGARYDRDCAMVGHPWACDYVALVIGAGELSRGLAECGDEAGAVSWYRAGRCGLRDTWHVRQVMATRDELAWGAP